MTSDIFFTFSETDTFKVLQSLASFSTSPATIANPLPASPALAASMLAFNANIFCCLWIAFN